MKQAADKILYLLFLFFSISLAGCQSATDSKPEALKGIIDLRKWDFEKDGNIELNGEWEFYWNKKVESRQTERDGKPHCGYFILPSQWNAVKSGDFRNLPPLGYATYRLKVKLPPATAGQVRRLALKLQDIHSAYKLWLNGRMFLEKGRFSEIPELEKEELGRETVSFEEDSDSLDIVIHASNFFDINEAGIDEEIILGTERNILMASHKKNFIYLVSFGILLIMSLYHFLLYIIRKKEKQYLYFSLICLLLSVQTICEGDKYIFYILPGLSVSLYEKIWLASIAVIALLIRFYRIFFPDEINNKVSGFFSAAYALIVAFLFIFPFSYFMPYVYSLFYFSMAGLLYLFSAVFLALIRKRRHSALVFAGMLLPLLAGVNDLLYGLAVIYTGYFGSVGFILLVFSQSYFLSLRYTQSFREVESLSEKLEEANRFLDSKVEQRTRELQEANSQLSRIIAIKNKFFSIIAHDMKNLFQSMLGYSDLIIMRAGEDSQREINEDASVIKDTSRKAYTLMENLLEWSLSETGNIQLKKEEVELKEVVNENIELLEAYSRQKGICLNSELEDIKISADRRMLNTILRNLISNAIKYSYTESEVKISARKLDGSVILSVEDEGEGIKKEKLDTLFNLDMVRSTPGTNKEKGTGLGLHLVYEFVQRHEGKISVKSQEGKGTTFVVVLPLH